MNNEMIEKRMTEGSPIRLLFFFSLPLILGQIFQQLYVVVDTMVVGRALGVEALAAIGSTDWYSWMTVGLITGFTQGFGILIARKFGEKDAKGLNRVAACSFVLSSLLAFLFLILLEGSVPFGLEILQIPITIRPLSATYLRMLFAGVPISMSYNILAVILRSLGDSKSPLRAMVIATVANIGLDLIFVLLLGWGVAGAAGATLIAQCLSAVYCYTRFRSLHTVNVSWKNLKIDRSYMLQMLKLGAPVALQNVMIAVGGILLQRIVDGFGVLFIAGFVATNKMYGLLECAAVAYGFAMVTYVGQNFGAGEIERIRRGWRSALVIALISCLFISTLMILFGRNILSLFISEQANEGAIALNYAYTYLRLMAIYLPILYGLHITRSALQGMGHTVIAMVSGIFELIMRIGSALLLPGLIGQEGLFYAEILAWIGADLVLLPGYFYHIRKLLKQQ